MSLGPVMMDLAGPELSAAERDMLRHPLVGAVILFSRNYVSPEQIEALVKEIHELREPRLLVAVDHEGGRVQRFREGFSRLPPVRQLGTIYDSSQQLAKRLAETCGWLMASELRAVGIDFSFAPVLDVDRGISQVIGDRAFHTNPQALADLAHSYMIGMKHAGMAATGKHFPGHGGVEADSHTAIPIDERRYEDIYAEDILPFERMIHYGLAAIMPAHVIYLNVDPHPAGFSPFWMREVLRGRLEFQGAIFSDDLSMEGASVAGNFMERAEAALHAGCDMVLVCNNPEAAAQVLDGLGDYNDPVAYMRLVRMRGRGQTSRVQLQHNPAWTQAIKAVNTLVADAASGENLTLL
ncbi:MAG: beta-N-acetylhexosaminidase [Gammaproteobacteria bacterium]